jgi:hypothetical protein
MTLHALSLLALFPLGSVRADAERLERELRHEGAVVARLASRFAESQRHVALEVPAAALPTTPCTTLAIVGPSSLAFRVEGPESSGIDVRATRGLALVASCGTALPPEVTVSVSEGRGALEVRLVGSAEPLDEEVLLATLRPAPDLARDRTPVPEALPAPTPAVDGVESLAGYRRVRVEADRQGHATLEEPWVAGCRRLVVRADDARDVADLDVIVDGPGLSRWLEDRGPASIVDRVVCTPKLEPATVRVSDAVPGSTVRVEEGFLQEIAAFEPLRREVERARLATIAHAARFEPTPRPVVLVHGVAGLGEVPIARERGRCEGLLVTFADRRRAPRVALVTPRGLVPFVRVAEGSGFALAQCQGFGATTRVRIDASSAWTLASVDLGEAP